MTSPTIDFLLISDPKIWAVPVQECGEALVDIRADGYQLIDTPHSQNPSFTLVRASVAQKLRKAKQFLPAGWNFLFSEGHRPLAIQRKIYNDYYQDMQRQHPDWDHIALRRATEQFVAPPENVPPHSTGGAFDLTLVDDQGNEVDMGSRLDDWPDRNEYRNFTAAPNISATGRANRQILIDALSRVGFINYPAEWWHWSYGDKYWAYHAQQPAALYDSTG